MRPAGGGGGRAAMRISPRGARTRGRWARPGVTLVQAAVYARLAGRTGRAYAARGAGRAVLRGSAESALGGNKDLRMRIVKREVERRFAEHFLHSQGLTAAIESVADGAGPDFVLRTPESQIGLELTRVSQDESSEGSGMRAVEGRRRQLLEGARAWWESQGLPARTVQVSFLPGRAPTKAQIPAAIRALVAYVRTNAEGSTQRARYRVRMRPEAAGLPAVASVTIWPGEAQGRSVWLPIETALIPDLTPALVLGAVDRKHAKLPIYRQAYPITWLLIVLEGGRPSGSFSLTPQALDHEYTSDFTKTVLFESFDGRIVELRTRPRARPPAA